MRLEPLAAAILVVSASGAATVPPQVTFTRDVAPILEKNGQGSHRPGEAAPFSLLTYQQARPWAKAIKEAVRLKKMPPWFADPHYGKFSNAHSLAAKDVDAIAAWADAGAPEGDPKDLPAPLSFVEGWSIPKPDVVFQPPRRVFPALHGPRNVPLRRRRGDQPVRHGDSGAEVGGSGHGTGSHRGGSRGCGQGCANETALRLSASSQVPRRRERRRASFTCVKP